MTTGIDDPAVLAAQRAHKHARRVPFVFRPTSPLTAIEQHEQAARRTLELALSLARARTPAPITGAGEVLK